MISFEDIDRNLDKCWDYYKDYVEEFRKNHYSDEIPEDFISWCDDNLKVCSCCGEVVLEDEIPLDPLNSDEVCEYCIRDSGYYE